MVTKRKSTPASDAATPKRPRTASHDGSEAPKPSLNARRNVKANVKMYKPGEACTYIPKVITAKDMATTEYRSVQRNTCQRWPTSVVNDQCMSCIEKQAACGTCRFLNLRVFRETVDEKGIVAVDYEDYAFRGNQDDPIEPAKPPRSTKRENKKFRTRIATKAYSMDLEVPEGEEQKDITRSGNTYPTPERAVPLQARREDAEYVVPIIAPSFIEHLARELRHEKTHLHQDTSSTLPGGPRPMIRIKNTPQTKTICDVCSTSVYMGSYMCGCCGRELCLGCWEEFLPSAQMYSGRVSRIDQCSRKRRHTRDSMLFVTRAHPGEIDTLLGKVEGLSKDLRALSTNVDEVVAQIPTKAARPPSSNGPSYLPVPSAHYKDIDLQTFQCLWRKGGVPLVLTNMLERFQLPWSPQYFIDEHGAEYCLIHDCDDDTFHETHVAAFFARFGGKLDKSYKLKDWPPSSEFKAAFPKLWDDFENALPFPEYTRRSGPFNLASHIPSEWNAPDLGPKMYNAYPAVDFLPRDISSMTPGQKIEFQKNVVGTTNLHLDLTDAVNVMLFASGGQDAPEIATTDKGIPQCGAVWDIFPPSSAVAIRAYLKETRDEVDDPIHRQCFYLSEHDLEMLAQRGVGSYRIFQDPGDAIFIPAGCPHQVRNRRSCVKVAVDFLSPENVHLCTRLIEEARSMAPRIPKPGMKLTGKEDVLQLWNCLGFAWEEMEKHLTGAASAQSLPTNGQSKKDLPIRGTTQHYSRSDSESSGVTSISEAMNQDSTRSQPEEPEPKSSPAFPSFACINKPLPKSSDFAARFMAQRTEANPVKPVNRFFSGTPPPRSSTIIINARPDSTAMDIDSPVHNGKPRLPPILNGFTETNKLPALPAIGNVVNLSPGESRGFGNILNYGPERSGSPMLYGGRGGSAPAAPEVKRVMSTSPLVVRARTAEVEMYEDLL